jgi:hypothetical protein
LYSLEMLLNQGFAALISGAMENLRAEAGARIDAGMAPALAQATTSVTTALGPSKFETEFKAGHQLSRDAAARLARREAASPAVAASDHGSAGSLALFLSRGPRPT